MRPGVVGAGHERVHHLAVGRDRGDLDAAVLVLEPLRLAHAARAALDGHGVRLLGVRDAHRDVANAVAVLRGEARDLVVVAQRTRQDEADLALTEDVGRPIAHARLGSRVRVARKAEGVLEVVRGLLRVPDPELDVVPALERHRILRHAAILAPTGSPASSAAGRRHRRSRTIPRRIATPPTIWSQCRCSERISAAKIAATNGCALANSVAREGPTTPIDLNHRMLVRKSGPTIANARPTHTRVPSDA